MSILYRRAGQWGTSSCYQLVRFFVLTAPEQVRFLFARHFLATQLKYPGVAGYGNDSWAIGQSYADHPILQPVVYNSSAPAGSQWSRDGLPASAVPRMYHSTATLLPDGEGAVIVFRLDRYSNESPGSVLVAGSNPNSDYVDSGIPYPTEYRLEKFYPAYFKQRRPSPTGIPNSLRYGGPFFNLSLSSSDLFEDAGNVKHSKVVVMRTGFSTHTMVRTNRASAYMPFPNDFNP